MISNVIILDFTRDKLVQIISAATGFFNHGEWTLNKGRTYVLSGNSDITRILQFERLVIPGIKNAQQALDNGKVAPKDMNMSELLNYIDILRRSNSVSNDLLVRLYQKFSQPLACLIVALAGAPLGLLGQTLPQQPWLNLQCSRSFSLLRFAIQFRRSGGSRTY